MPSWGATPPAMVALGLPPPPGPPAPNAHFQSLVDQRIPEVASLRRGLSSLDRAVANPVGYTHGCASGWCVSAGCVGAPVPLAMSPQPSALSPQPSALSPQPSALSPQPSASSPQPSALSPQPSALSPHPSLLNPRLSASPLTPHSSLLRWSTSASTCQSSVSR